MQCLGKKGKSKVRSMKERARDSKDSKDWGRLVKAPRMVLHRDAHYFSEEYSEIPEHWPNSSLT